MIQEQVVRLGKRPRLLSCVFGANWFGLDVDASGGGYRGLKYPSSGESR
jgi:hypothetical protein